MAWEDNPGDLHLSNPYLVKVHKAYQMFFTCLLLWLGLPKIGLVKWPFSRSMWTMTPYSKLLYMIHLILLPLLQWPFLSNELPLSSWFMKLVVIRNYTASLRSSVISLNSIMNLVWAFSFIGMPEGKPVDISPIFNSFNYWPCRSGIPDGQPKLLLSLIPDYPMLNFMLTTSIYIVVSGEFKFALQRSSQIHTSHAVSCLQVSHRLFNLTNTLKNAFVPSKDNKRLFNNMISAAVISSVLYSLSFVFLKFPRIWVSFSKFNWSYFHIYFQMRVNGDLVCTEFKTINISYCGGDQ